MNEIKQIEIKQRNSAHKLGTQGNCKEYQKAKLDVKKNNMLYIVTSTDHDAHTAACHMLWLQYG